MINYKKTKETMSARGIEFTNAQFSFALMVAVGIDKYDAYKIAIKNDDFSNVKKDKFNEFEDKCKKECDISIQQQNITQLINFLKEKYEYQITEYVSNPQNVEITPKMLKNLIGRMVKKANDNFETTSFKEMTDAVNSYIKFFNPDIEDDNDLQFNKHFITVYPSYNAICCNCNKEFDLPANVTSVCPHCGHKYLWDEEKKIYLY